MVVLLFRREDLSASTRNDDIRADEYEDEGRCTDQHDPDEIRVPGIPTKLAFIPYISHNCLDAGARNPAALPLLQRPDRGRRSGIELTSPTLTHMHRRLGMNLDFIHYLLNIRDFPG